MSDYLLPCACGQKLPVSTRQAGQAVRCACGAPLEVPTLRGLRQLEQAERPAKASRRAWGARHRAAFVLVALSLAAAAAAGYLALNLPPEPAGSALVQIDVNTPIALAVAVSEELKTGLHAGPSMISEEDRIAARHRDLMLWGVKIALALAGCGLVVAGAVLLSGGRKKR